MNTKLKSLGETVIDAILQQGLITAKWHRDKGTWCVPHTHSADQIEKVILDYQSPEKYWVVKFKGKEIFFNSEQLAVRFAHTRIPLGVEFQITATTLKTCS